MGRSVRFSGKNRKLRNEDRSLFERGSFAPSAHALSAVVLYTQRNGMPRVAEFRARRTRSESIGSRSRSVGLRRRRQIVFELGADAQETNSEFESALCSAQPHSADAAALQNAN